MLFKLLREALIFCRLRDYNYASHKKCHCVIKDTSATSFGSRGINIYIKIQRNRKQHYVESIVPNLNAHLVSCIKMFLTIKKKPTFSFCPFERSTQNSILEL